MVLALAYELKKQLVYNNKYRVLLTRARQGMIIYIPEGSNEDVTRNPKNMKKFINTYCVVG